MHDINVEYVAGIIFTSGIALLFIIALVVLLSKLLLMRESVKDLIDDIKELEKKSNNAAAEAKNEK